jgi:hypothetical protein
MIFGVDDSVEFDKTASKIQFDTGATFSIIPQEDFDSLKLAVRRNA